MLGWSCRKKDRGRTLIWGALFEHISIYGLRAGGEHEGGNPKISEGHPFGWTLLAAGGTKAGDNIFEERNWVLIKLRGPGETDIREKLQTQGRGE